MSEATFIQLWEPTGECCICGDETLLTHSVAFCCEPTHDEIGALSSIYRDTEVGGMPACKSCHDKHYAIRSLKMETGQ